MAHPWAPAGSGGDDNGALISVNPGYEDLSMESGVRQPGHVFLNVPTDDHTYPVRRAVSLQTPRSSHETVDDDDDREWARSFRRETAELLDSLPSRQLEKAISGTNTGHHGRAATYKPRKTASVPHHHYASQRRRPRSDAEVAEVIAADITEYIRKEEDNFVSPDARTVDLLSNMTNITLAVKRDIRRRVSKRYAGRTPGRLKQLGYNISISFLHFKYRIAEIAYYAELWKSHLKTIQGHFGSSVTSYFRFLKWLFYLNIPIFLLTLAFVILPQALFRSQTDRPSDNVTFSGLDLIQGDGWFTNTEMYYGFYTNGNVTVIPNITYEMQYAYLFTCGGYYLLCLIILAYSMSKSYRTNYIEGRTDLRYYPAGKVFCSWDYGIISPDASALKSKSIYNELLEYLAGGLTSRTDDSCSELLTWFCIRAFTNLLVLGLIGGASYLVYYMSVTNALETELPFLQEMALPITVSVILLVLPLGFGVIAMFEKYRKPKTELYFNMVRTMLLKAAILVVLVYYWFNVVPCPAQLGDLNPAQTEAERLTDDCSRCWETLMGQQIYRLVLVDFVFILLVTFFEEFVRRLLHQYCCKKMSAPEFNIGRNTLDLIYSQTLCWLGTFYCPFLSLILIVKLFIIFYVKRVSVIQNCTPSEKPWRASHTHTIFQGFLFCFFLLAAVAVTCSIIFIRPSPNCGPYQGQSTTYFVVLSLIQRWETEEKWVAYAIEFVGSPGFIVVILVLLCVGTYYMRIMMKGHAKMVELLQDQLKWEGKDKVYLLQELQNLNVTVRQNFGSDTTAITELSAMTTTTLEVDSTTDYPVSPGGKVFVKTAVNQRRGQQPIR